MRIWIKVPDESLRRALSDLLVEHGHAVEAQGTPVGQVDLAILSDSADAEWARSTAVLLLRPGPGEVPDANPSWALSRALQRGGRAVWSSPLDAGRLVDVLAEREGREAAPDREALDEDAPIASSPDPWLLFSPDSRRLLWANHAARARLGLEVGSPADPLRSPALLPLRDAPAVRDEGRARVDLSGRPVLAVWWTDRRGRRALGLMDLPATSSEAGLNDLKALAEIGRLTTTFAHEIRNPVAALAGALDLLEAGGGPEEREEVLTLARERLAQMKTLLDDTLRLARPFKGPPEPVDLVAVAESAIGGVKTDPLFARIHVEVSSPPHAPLALGWAEPLRHAVVNLLLNAAQAQDGVGRVAVLVSEEDGRAVLRVEDDGPGIPPEHRERVFAPFWTTKTEGTGLGLAFVRRVAQESGGRVSVEDAKKGARIRIELPLAPPA